MWRSTQRRDRSRPSAVRMSTRAAGGASAGGFVEAAPRSPAVAPRQVRVGCFACAALFFSVEAGAGMPRVIFSNIQSSPTSDVPGLPGVKFYNGELPGGPTFGRPNFSPNGEHWALRVIFTGPSAMREGVLVGNGGTALVLARRGTPTFFDAGVNYAGLTRGPMGANDSGSFAFSADTTAPTSSDSVVVRWTAVDGFTLMAREGVQAAGQPIGVLYGAGGGDVHMLEDDSAAFISGSLIGSGHSAAFVNSSIAEGVVLIETQVTVPNDQLGAPAAVQFLDRFRSDASASNIMYTGRLANGHDFIAVNHSIVAERGRPLPGGYPGIFTDPDALDEGASLSPYNGHYAFRNRADFDSDGFSDGGVVVVDDHVVAASGDAIYPGSDEVYFIGGSNTTPFLLNLVDSHGDYLVHGAASVDMASVHGVYVFNGRTLVVASLARVDLDGDGRPDDGYRYCGLLSQDGACMTDDGRLFMSIGLCNNMGETIGQAFVWMPLPKPADTNCDLQVDLADIDPFLQALFNPAGYEAAFPGCYIENADVDESGTVDFLDIDPFVNCLFGGCGVQGP